MMATILLLDLSTSSSSSGCTSPEPPLSWRVAAELAGWTSWQDVQYAWQNVPPHSRTFPYEQEPSWSSCPPYRCTTFPSLISVHNKYFATDVQPVVGFFSCGVDRVTQSIVAHGCGEGNETTSIAQVPRPTGNHAKDSSTKTAKPCQTHCQRESTNSTPSRAARRLSCSSRYDAMGSDVYASLTRAGQQQHVIQHALSPWLAKFSQDSAQTGHRGASTPSSSSPSLSSFCTRAVMDESVRSCACVWVVRADDDPASVPWHLFDDSTLTACHFRMVLVFGPVSDRWRATCVEQHYEYVPHLDEVQRSDATPAGKLTHAPCACAWKSDSACHLAPTCRWTDKAHPVLEAVPASACNSGLLAGTLCGSARVLQALANVVWSESLRRTCPAKRLHGSCSRVAAGDDKARAATVHDTHAVGTRREADSSEETRDGGSLKPRGVAKVQFDADNTRDGAVKDGTNGVGMCAAGNVCLVCVFDADVDDTSAQLIRWMKHGTSSSDEHAMGTHSLDDEPVRNTHPEQQQQQQVASSVHKSSSNTRRTSDEDELQGTDSFVVSNRYFDARVTLRVLPHHSLTVHTLASAAMSSAVVIVMTDLSALQRAAVHVRCASLDVDGEADAKVCQLAATLQQLQRHLSRVGEASCHAEWMCDGVTRDTCSNGTCYSNTTCYTNNESTTCVPNNSIDEGCARTVRHRDVVQASGDRQNMQSNDERDAMGMVFVTDVCVEDEQSASSAESALRTILQSRHMCCCCRRHHCVNSEDSAAPLSLVEGVAHSSEGGDEDEDSWAFYPSFELVWQASACPGDANETHGLARVREALEQHLWPQRTLTHVVPHARFAGCTRNSATAAHVVATSVPHLSPSLSSCVTRSTSCSGVVAGTLDGTTCLHASNSSLLHVESIAVSRTDEPTPISVKEGEKGSEKDDNLFVGCELPETFMIDPRTMRSAFVPALQCLSAADRVSNDAQSVVASVDHDTLPRADELLAWVDAMKTHGDRLSRQTRKRQAALLASALERTV